MLDQKTKDRFWEFVEKSRGSEACWSWRGVNRLKISHAMVCTKGRSSNLVALRKPFLWAAILILILCLPGGLQARRLHLER